MGIKKSMIYSAILILIIIIIFLIFWYFKRPSTYETINLRISDRLIRVVLADDFSKRTRGLSGRQQLGEDEGMLFIFPYKDKYSFWMKDMNFPIDIIWISDDKIVGVEESVDPQIDASVINLKMYHPSEPINYVLELSAGSFQKRNFKIGDLIKFDK